MTFSWLETSCIGTLMSIISGLMIKTWADSSFIKKVDCIEARKSCAVNDIKALRAMMRLVCEKLGITVEEQIKLEKEL